MFIGESVQMLKDTENLKMHRYDENVGKNILHSLNSRKMTGFWSDCYT